MTGRGARLREFFESFMRELVRQVEKGHGATDRDLLQFQGTISANVLTGPQTRHTILLRKLLLFDPGFAEVLGQEGILESAIQSKLSESMASLQESIYVVNTAYSGTHGGDLFKATNETTQAVAIAGQAVTNVKEYGAFVDALYFLLFEGSGEGARFPSGLPQVVTDIKDLRTQMRHDVDHGKPAKARSKNKHLAGVFRKYANASSPQVLNPDLFPVVQARILSDVDQMLMNLRAAA
jgi:hypothetical protein